MQNLCPTPSVAAAASSLFHPLVLVQRWRDPVIFYTMIVCRFNKKTELL